MEATLLNNHATFDEFAACPPTTTQLSPYSLTAGKGGPAEHLSVAYRALQELKPYRGNARTHSKAQVKKIADSIKSFGFTNPVLIDATDTIIAGHGRVAAAKLLNMD